MGLPLKCQAHARLTCFYLEKRPVSTQHFLYLLVRSREPPSLEVSRVAGSILLPDKFVKGRLSQMFKSSVNDTD